jgi:hypothetical protein
MRIKFLVIAILALLLAACVPISTTTVTLPYNWKPQVFTIEVESVTVGGDHSLQINTPSTCAGIPGENGCIEVAAGKIGIITFVLDNGTAKSCEGQTDDTWVWQGVRLTAMPNVVTSGGTTRKKVGSISLDARTDFGAEKDGQVDSVTIEGQYMSLRDQNSKEYDIWYTLVAMQCGDSSVTATSDPRVKNHGSPDSL